MDSEKQEVVRVKKGRLLVIYGPMFCGKTTELLRRVRRLRASGRVCYVMKHKLDERYSKGPFIESHDHQCMNATTVSSLEQADPEEISRSDVICIDEGQFMPNLRHYVDEWLNQGKDVIVAGLNLDFKKGPFPEMVPLLMQGDKLIHLTAICKCGEKAPFSHRKSHSTELYVVGGSETYESLCRTCYSLAILS